MADDVAVLVLSMRSPVDLMAYADPPPLFYKQGRRFFMGGVTARVDTDALELPAVWMPRTYCIRTAVPFCLRCPPPSPPADGEGEGTHTQEDEGGGLGNDSPYRRTRGVPFNI